MFRVFFVGSNLVLHFCKEVSFGGYSVGMEVGEVVGIWMYLISGCPGGGDCWY